MNARFSGAILSCGAQAPTIAEKQNKKTHQQL